MTEDARHALVVAAQRAARQQVCRQWDEERRERRSDYFTIVRLLTRVLQALEAHGDPDDAGLIFDVRDELNEQAPLVLQ